MIVALIVALVITADTRARADTQLNNVNEKNQKLEQDIKKLQEDNRKLKIVRAKHEADKKSWELVQQSSGLQPIQRVRSANFSGGEIASYILAVFGKDGEMALAIAMAESRLSPTATNWNDARYTGCPSYGIFQINRCDQRLYDWKYNVQEAHKMFHARGWLPWTCFTNGAYLKYL